MHIGYHESTSDGLYCLGTEALSVSADTFAFFTRNPRGGQAKAIDKEDADRLNAFMKDNNFAPPVAHAPYTMNPCSANEGLRQFALQMMTEDFLRLEYIPGCFYNFHPGSHTGQGSETGIALTSSLIADAISLAEKQAGNLHTVLLIETMSGKGSEIGRTFEEVKQIMDLANEKYGASLENKLGVCLDTCHIWDAGYDIVNNLDDVITSFDKIIGLKNLHAIHLNDSMNELGSHKDRHEKIGKGKIGLDALSRVTRHAALKNLPFILETPNDKEGYREEIRILKEKE